MTDAELALMLQREEQQAHLLELAGYGDGECCQILLVAMWSHSSMSCAPPAAAALTRGPARRSSL